MLRVRDLRIEFPPENRGDAPRAAVECISYDITPGRTLGIVGESGCGKSLTALAIMGLLPPTARVTNGSIRLADRDLVAASEVELATLRGRRVSMVFQEPMTALNPAFTVGDQIAETLRIHLGMDKRTAWTRAVEMLARVHIPSPNRRAFAYPHQLSGGMRQRAMIAMALACGPDLLIADEPTTALDVTIQAQIVDLMLEMQEEFGMAIQFISHDLGVVSELADDVAVMYAGRVVEVGPAETVFSEPVHPYTRGMLATVPQIGLRDSNGCSRMATIPGTVPSLGSRPAGCCFADRCPMAQAECREAPPPPRPLADGRQVACYRTGE